MGYTTDFWGSVTIEPPLNNHEISYLNDFAESRRMHRTGGPYLADPGGDNGQYRSFLQGGTEERTPPDTILDFNRPDPTQPGLWCQWIPTHDGTAIQWDGGEKFYFAAEWMQYLIDHFLKPGAKAASSSTDPRFEHFTFNHTLNGVIDAQGESPDDRWQLHVKDNVVETVTATSVWES